MKCSHCFGKTAVKDCVSTAEENYRKRLCLNCGHIFFTIEFEVENDEKLKNTWRKNDRRNRRKAE